MVSHCGADFDAPSHESLPVPTRTQRTRRAGTIILPAPDQMEFLISAEVIRVHVCCHVTHVTYGLPVA